MTVDFMDNKKNITAVKDKLVSVDAKANNSLKPENSSVVGSNTPANSGVNSSPSSSTRPSSTPVSSKASVETSSGASGVKPSELGVGSKSTPATGAASVNGPKGEPVSASSAPKPGSVSNAANTTKPSGNGASSLDNIPSVNKPYDSSKSSTLAHVKDVPKAIDSSKLGRSAGGKSVTASPSVASNVKPKVEVKDLPKASSPSQVKTQVKDLPKASSKGKAPAPQNSPYAAKAPSTQSPSPSAKASSSPKPKAGVVDPSKSSSKPEVKPQVKAGTNVKDMPKVSSSAKPNGSVNAVKPAVGVKDLPKAVNPASLTGASNSANTTKPQDSVKRDTFKPNNKIEASKPASNAVSKVKETSVSAVKKTVESKPSVKASAVSSVKSTSASPKPSISKASDAPKLQSNKPEVNKPQDKVVSSVVAKSTPAESKPPEAKSSVSKAPVSDAKNLNPPKPNSTTSGLPISKPSASKPIQPKVSDPKPLKKPVTNGPKAGKSVNSSIEKTMSNTSSKAVSDLTANNNILTAPVDLKAEAMLPETKANKIEVVPRVNNKEAVRLRPEPLKPVSRWAFWKRASQRDEQLTRISEGYIELVDMVRSIKDQADAQYENNMIMRESLQHLPTAIKSLEGFGKSQEQVGLQVGQALDKINLHMKSASNRDEKMANAMQNLDGTLKGVGDASKASTKTFDRVQERMRDSDIRMENLFNNVRSSEEKVSETMMRLQRNMSIIQGFFLICLLCVIGGLIYIILNKNDLKDTPIENNKEKVERPTK